MIRTLHYKWWNERLESLKRAAGSQSEGEAAWAGPGLPWWELRFEPAVSYLSGPECFCPAVTGHGECVEVPVAAGCRDIRPRYNKRPVFIFSTKSKRTGGALS